MGVSKVEEFTLRDNRVAAYAKALSHPARVAILRLLLQKKSCVCGDIVSELPLSQSTVSQHLKELKAAGLIQGEIEGTSVCYCINAEIWKHAGKYLGDFMNMSPVSDKKCC
jgi:ArsR family transcriptional regulator, arsenate/arsenite/antimonite-responsive transcriptional repressor